MTNSSTRTARLARALQRVSGRSYDNCLKVVQSAVADGVLPRDWVRTNPKKVAAEIAPWIFDQAGSRPNAARPTSNRISDFVPDFDVTFDNIDVAGMLLNEYPECEWQPPTPGKWFTHNLLGFPVWGRAWSRQEHDPDDTGAQRAYDDGLIWCLVWSEYTHGTSDTEWRHFEDFRGLTFLSEEAALKALSTQLHLDASAIMAKVTSLISGCET